jgi:hypothetical protein
LIPQEQKLEVNIDHVKNLCRRSVAYDLSHLCEQSWRQNSSACLAVGRDFKRRRVDIVVPDSDGGVLLYAGSRRVRDFLHEQPSPIRYDAPVAVLRRGEFYANAWIMKNAFRNKFSTTWNASTRTITLRRTDWFGKQMQALAKIKK